MSDVQALSSAPERFALRSERLGPLPLINHFIERIGLPDLLARHVPSDARCSIPHAQALGVLLRSLVVQREPIYRQQETVHGFAGSMFGISAQDMEHLGDDRLGRALDHLFDADRAALLTEVAVVSHVRSHFTGLFVPHTVTGKVDDAVAQFEAGAVRGPGFF